ncbi:MAG: BlaI/MecI/CopY family transcriptional regulator [Lachnospiraceae bacterium]|nr:BlaI/MecI/CopY family transcriptional regulator [Lachnospiraceae bacterium]MCD7763261.1 BlaI/MecI/CopY family transcriptional regulator [Lachnospiraceae bacterium]
MDDMRLGTVEAHFANLIWENEPITSGELVKLCNRELEWKKSTTYTVLKKLCNRGIFQNVNGVVSSVISKEEFTGIQCAEFVDKKFNGFLPAFVTSFAKQRKLTDEEVQELDKIIKAYREEQ